MDMSDTKYLIRKVETCAECEGSGMVYNQDWAEINEANNAWMEEHTEGRFTDAAVKDWERRIKEKWPHQKHTPPEEEPCIECEGTGKVEKWIDLREALKELGVSMLPPDWEEQLEHWAHLQGASY